MTFIANNLLYIYEMRLVSLLLLVLSLILVMLGHIFKLPERLIFSTVYLSLGAAFLSNIFAPINAISTASLGISFDALAHAGLLLVIGSFFFVLIMVQVKLSSYNQKMTSVLLLLLSLLGAIVTVISHNWMIFFAALQCLSLPIYGLLAYDPNNKISVSASTRYLVLSSVAMAFTLFGIMLLYAATGTMDFYQQGLTLPLLWQESSLLILLGFSFILVGVAFKLSLCPFHFWVPEVYQGAELFMVGHLAVIAKAAMLLAFARAWFLVFSVEPSIITDILGLMSILSMWIGSGLMVFEKNFMRLLAYLSIAHLGLLLTALLAHNALGVEALFLDLGAFALSLFLVLAALWNKSATLSDFNGLLKQTPWRALILTLGLLSLVGVPLTAGFIGKYAIFSAVIDAKMWNFLPHMIVSSLFGAISIARFILAMFEAKSEGQILLLPQNYNLKRPIAIMVVLGLFYVGLFPQTGIVWAKKRSASLPFFAEISQDLDK